MSAFMLLHIGKGKSKGKGRGAYKMQCIYNIHIYTRCRLRLRLRTQNIITIYLFSIGLNRCITCRIKFIQYTYECTICNAFWTMLWWMLSRALAYMTNAWILLSFLQIAHNARTTTPPHYVPLYIYMYLYKY